MEIDLHWKSVIYFENEFSDFKNETAKKFTDLSNNLQAAEGRISSFEEKLENVNVSLAFLAYELHTPIKLCFVLIFHIDHLRLFTVAFLLAHFV